MPSGDIFLVLKWWLTILSLGFIFLPTASKIFSSFFDKGYVFSKIFGIIIVSYLIFTLSNFQILKFTPVSIFLIALVCLIINLIIFYKLRPFGIKEAKIFLFEEVLFLSLIFLWTFVRGHNPDVHDLEKYMDFGFMNSILRTEYFPPKDMWLTPHSINYYYFGHLFTAVVTKISNIPSYITFNLMLATIFSLCFTTSFSIGANLINNLKIFAVRKSIIIGLFFGYVVTLGGNMQPIYSVFSSYQGGETAPAFWSLAFSPQTFPNSYWYPNATRFIYHTIHEFPSYSFVVADLHGHVLSIPIVLTLIAIFLLLILEKKIKMSTIIASSFLISAAYMTNAWDGLIYFGLLTNIIFFLQIKNNKVKNSVKKIAYSIISSAKYILPVLCLFFIFSFVFNKNFSPFASGVGFICSPDFLTNIKSIGPFLFEEGQCERSPIWQLLILYGFFIFMLSSFLIFLRNRKLKITDYFVLIISFFSLVLIIFPEFFYLKDIYSSYFRANTMFKLSYQAFVMLSISSAYIFIRITSSFKEFRGRLSRIFFMIFFINSLILLFIVLVYPYFSIPSGYGKLEKYKNLNGLKYLEADRPDDFKAINWINKNISGQPVILEAQGDSYTDYGRISANTGLPTVLGWTVHEWLWRGSYDIPASRFDDIKNLYESENLNISNRIIDKYKISFVYIGSLEEEKYNISEEKFKKLGDLIYSDNDTRIYKIN